MAALAMPDGRWLVFPGMVHFAPYHQSTIAVFEVRNQSETKIFPGQSESDLARSYRQSIVKAHYGAVDEFDRSTDEARVSADGRSLAFVVSYRFHRFPDRSSILV